MSLLQDGDAVVMGSDVRDADFCFSTFAQSVRLHLRNPSLSDVEFVNALLAPYVNAGDVRNRHGRPFDLDKNRVSRLLLRKDEVPTALRNATSIYGIVDSTARNMQDFVDDFLVERCGPVLARDVLDLCAGGGDVRMGALESLQDCADQTNTFLAVALIEAFSRKNRKDDMVNIWRRGQNCIDVVCGDLFKYGFGSRSKRRNIVVIPVNSTFETEVTTSLETSDIPLVSEMTMHGQWLIRMEAIGLDSAELSHRIKRYLAKRSEPIGMTRNGTDVYPIGTVAVVETDNTSYFLVAISVFDERGNATSSETMIRESLESLLAFYDSNGQGYDMYLPLIGTGRSRAGLSPQESLDLIISAIRENEKNALGRISIVVPPKMYEQMTIATLGD